MKFIVGTKLTAEMRRLASRKGEKKIAIAYWGTRALQLLRLNPQRKDVRILCCLKGGKSDPDVVEKFGKRAKQNDRLHAKVLWTPSGAVIGSANASSNGLPEEENRIDHLLEAGIYLDNGPELKKIESWFDIEFEHAREIKSSDLKAARIARGERFWGKSSPRSPKKALIDALREGGKKEFLQQRIFIAIYKYKMSDAEERQAKEFRKNNVKSITKRLLINAKTLRSLEYYSEWSELPKGAYLIDVHYHKRGTTVRGPYKTFDLPATWKGITYVLPPKYVKFAYKLTVADKRVIKAAIKELWSKAGRGSDGRIIRLIDAAPILLDHAN